MTRLADQHKAINLAQGFPDFDAPEVVKEAARAAIAAGVNQYPMTWGSPTLRGAIAAKYARFGWPEIDPETEIVVTCGSTEGMASTFLALIDPGDEVLLFEPFYENYGPDAFISGAVPRVVALGRPGTFFDELARAYEERRGLFLGLLAGTGFDAIQPEGAYYTMTNVAELRSRRGLDDDTAFCVDLVVNGGVAAVPGSSFFADPSDGRDIIRLAFPKRMETLRLAGDRLAGYAAG